MNFVNVYAIPSLLSAICFIILTIYVLAHNPKRLQNRVTAIFFLGLIIWSIAEMFERFSGPPPQALMEQWSIWKASNTPPPSYDWNEYGLALFFGKLIGVGVLLICPAGIHFSLVVPKKRQVSKLLLGGLYGSYFVFLAILLGTDHFIDTMIPYYAGWGTHNGDWMLLYFGYVLFGTLITVINLTLSFVRAKSKIEKNQTMFVLAGIMIAVGMTIPTAVIPSILGWEMYPLTTVSFIIMAVFMTYAIVKYKLFVIEAVTEEKIDEKEKVDIKPGFSYLFIGKNKSMPYSAFRSLVSEYPGLCITTGHPRKVRQKYKLDKEYAEAIEEHLPEHQEGS